MISIVSVDMWYDSVETIHMSIPMVGKGRCPFKHLLSSNLFDLFDEALEDQSSYSNRCLHESIKGEHITKMKKLN